MNTTTTRDQYAGLNNSGVSTMINRIGRTGSMVGRTRDRLRIEAEELEVDIDGSGGV